MSETAKLSTLPTLLEKELSPLREFFADNYVTEIMCNADGSIWVEKNGTINKTNVNLTENSRNIILKRVARHFNQDCVADDPSSMVNAEIEGMRISGGLKPLSPAGSFFSIRKHLPPELRPSLEMLVGWGMATAKQAELILEHVVQQKLNTLIVGATSSGKTTVANAILGKLPAHERVITIEDSAELNITVPNVLALKTNVQKGITARSLVQLAMRQRPDRVVLGETRGDETYDLVRAMNSGHDGTVSTIHASSAAMGLEALEMLYQMSLPADASIPTAVARQYIASGVKLLIFAARRYELLADGSQKAVRRIEEICLVKGVSDDQYLLEYV